MDIDSTARYNRGRAVQNSSREPCGRFVAVAIGMGVGVHSIEFLLPVLSHRTRCDRNESDQTVVLPARRPSTVLCTDR